MSDEKEEIAWYKRIGKWWIIILGVILSTGAVFWGILETGEFPDEKYISAAAFLMLIATSLLQNIDLNLQREDLKLNRRALEEQREEMTKHTKEFQESNESNIESLELQKFFELLRLKEELYVEIIKEKDEKKTNDLQSFNRIGLVKYRNSIVKYLFENFKSEFREEAHPAYPEDYTNVEVQNVYRKLNDIEKVTFNNLVKEWAERIQVISGNGRRSENSIIKLYTYHVLLRDMVSEGSPGIFNLHKVSQDIVNKVNKSIREMQYGSEKKPKTMKQIYDGVLTEDEKDLYKILDRNLTIKDLFEIED